LQSGQESEAIEQILIALRMQGTDVNTRLCLANLLHCVGRTDEAIAELHVTSEMFPKSPHALVRLAQIHVSRDDEFAAEKALRQALLRVPKHIECEMMLGHIQLKRGMDAEAAACANRVLAIDSQMFEAHQLLKAAQPAPAQPAAGPAT
jgi:Flp pilus assembly protein TadD